MRSSCSSSPSSYIAASEN
ncbi:hypothetical protein CXB51_016797 [Gossypium anomalum]|uniref:Uncharacterized protein n=1 Tax=Gossypium anomalum TaxID=47600 RepID=A0A8J6D098_9ROSI|nr:hypothetical protein CXB51_016797 [Gossypium anomalum]